MSRVDEAFGGATFDVDAGGLVMAHADDGGDVERCSPSGHLPG
jgi:hypothetical protein